MCKPINQEPQSVEQYGHAGVDGSGTERPSPKGRVPMENIEFTQRSITITFPFDIEIAYLADTNSMEPVLDYESLIIQKKVETDEDIEDLQAGDIASYQAMGGRLFHALTDIEEDSEGWMAHAKGYNNKTRDPFRLRKNNIKAVYVGHIQIIREG